MHLKHDVRPETFAKKPGAHGAHRSDESAPTTEPFVPGGQALHFPAESTPVALENVPCEHGRQVPREVAPTASLHVPSGQGVHFVLPWLSYVPLEHCSQLLSPAEEMYPGSHSTHETPPGTSPGLHTLQLKSDGAARSGQLQQGPTPQVALDVAGRLRSPQRLQV